MSDGKRTVQDLEGGRRRGRDDYEEEGEQSVAGSGISRADPEVLAQRRLLRVRPGAAAAAAAAAGAAGAGAFASIKSDASSSSGQQQQKSFENPNSGKPFVWGSGFYNPPQPKHDAPGYDLIKGGEQDAKGGDADSNKSINRLADDVQKPPQPSWTDNPFANNNNTSGSSTASSNTTNPFASNNNKTEEDSKNKNKTSSTESANPFANKNSSFTFTFAAPPSSMPSSSSSTTNNNNTSDASKQSGGASALAAAPTQATESNVSEKILYETDSCKLYLFHKDEETKQAAWKERGGGAFKIVLPDSSSEDKNNNNKTKAYLIMRNPQTRKAILSCPVDDSLKLGQTQELQLMFTSGAALDISGGPPPTDGVQSFLLRANKMAGKEVVENIVKNIKEQQERVVSA